VEPPAGFWDGAHTVTSVLVNVSVLAAAIAAAVKLRVFRLLSRRYRSELVCRHHVLANGRVVFVGEYTVHNTGERPLALTRVALRLHGAVHQGVLLAPDERTLLAERAFTPADADKRGLFHIEAGERSIFTLRCELPQLDEVVFLMCQLSLVGRADPAPFIGLYVRERPTQAEPAA